MHFFFLNRMFYILVLYAEKPHKNRVPSQLQQNIKTLKPNEWTFYFYFTFTPIRDFRGES